MKVRVLFILFCRFMLIYHNFQIGMKIWETTTTNSKTSFEFVYSLQDEY